MRAVLALFLACSMVLFSAAGVKAEPPRPFILDPDTPAQQLAGAMRFAPDRGDTLSDLSARYAEGLLDPSFTEAARQLQPYQPLWAVVEIQNGAPADGRPPDDWRLASDIYGLIALDVLLIRLGAETEQLLAHDIRQPFDPSDYAVNRLVSAPFDLRPEERALLIVRMVHGPTEALDLSLERGETVRATAFTGGLSLAAFYAFLLSCLLIFAVFSLLIRVEIGLAYAVLLLMGLGFVAYLDNFGFRWLYPQRPDLHLPLGVVLLLIVTSLGYLTAALSLVRLSGVTRLRKPLIALLIALAALAAICLPGAVLLSPDLMVPWAYTLLVGMLAAQVYAAFHWDVMGKAQRPVSRLIPLVALVGLGGVVVLAMARSQPGDLSIPWIIKGTYGALALTIMAGLSAGLIDMRRSHAAALAREVEAVRKEAQVTRDLLEAERNHARMRDLADQRRMQMASMSHDIRQPLSALRLTFERMTRDAPPDTRDHLREAFDYLQTLTAGHLDQSKEEVLAENRHVHEAASEERVDPYPLSLVLSAVGQMFGDEARAKALELHIVPCTAEVSVPPLHLMRIVSNLVSNAVKYTVNGRVLVGVRRRTDHLLVQVLDTGPGMTDEDLKRNMQAWQSGASSQGHGLGLAICQQLAAENGLELDVASRPDRGTAFCLRIPREVNT
ncbi:ATP-binding protein [Antarctobacter jejuensis]|uniref:ATP-binding protein n=1 Tax=Antarctobacter jejuensis TaxID=1439938 RepID=UPI003FD5D555